MNKEEIQHWANKYDEDNPDWIEKEKELGDKFREVKEVTLEDLLEINNWKFKKTNPDRWEENKLRIMRNKDTNVRAIARSVFLEITSDKDKIEKLYMSGVKNSLASVIMTFYDPENYGVFDKHVWQELFGEHLPQDLSGNPENYLRALEKLRDEAKKYKINVRTVEKACFKKHFDGAKFKRKRH